MGRVWVLRVWVGAAYFRGMEKFLSISYEGGGGLVSGCVRWKEVEVGEKGESVCMCVGVGSSRGVVWVSRTFVFARCFGAILFELKLLLRPASSPGLLRVQVF